ncbi:phosphate ABC transporter substrate-binding protein PstS [Microbacterium sp. SSM24]|uniref:phosphate ABC transporter substrate-binding protein PstS n=1 Tax=Microbacterium sp. SSM24 TaxID=2991714 RepID=UPI002226850D|nr:phosphate ABC transporter substrate-binding protein PstS [Microbacterium sp. SSM24]MCW3492012.1 phosphate ABC transporter substrate-binding protein PstS [Microbacterium sp. SSM24]
MKISRIAQVGAIAAIAALALAGCASNETPGEPSGSAPVSDLKGAIAGGGASSQEVAVQTWTAGVQGANPDVDITYDPSGSGAGRDSFIAGAVQFAGSDRAFKAEEITDSTFAGCVEDTDIVELPLYISPIAVIFNVEGVESLDLDAATIAGIFAGQITNWNDAAIADQNPDATLPDLAITPVVRSDKSGTTGNFTDYLAATAESVWTFGSVEEWPATSVTPESAQGTSGVVAAVEGGSGTIGYADASRAGDLGTVAIKVGDEYIAYSPEAAAKAADVSTLEEGRGAGDLAIKIDRTTTEAGAYPLILISYSIACEQYQDAAAAPIVKAYLSYAASVQGQDEAAAAAGSAPISDELRDQVNAAIELIVTD